MRHISSLHPLSAQKLEIENKRLMQMFSVTIRNDGHGKHGV